MAATGYGQEVTPPNAARPPRSLLAPLLLAVPLLLGSRPEPGVPPPFHAALNADLVGNHPDAWVSPEAWTALNAAAGDLAGPDLGLDAIVLRGPSNRDLPRKVKLPLRAAGPVTLLLGYTGEVARGTAIVRATVGASAGVERTVDLKSGDALFPLRAGGSGPDGVAVSAGEGRTLSVVHLDTDGWLALEVRNAEVDVAILGVVTGHVLRPATPTPPSFAGFPYPITLGTTGVAVPAGWEVPRDAASQGPITVRGGNFAFGDGRRARFWGVNLLNAACVPPKELADRLAVHLRAHGVNLARLHHCDSPRAGLLNPDRKTANDPLFLPEGLDRFDYLVSRLQEEGIFVKLEIATNRKFTAADGVTGPDDTLTNKMLPMFEPTWRAAYFQWTRDWLDRTNPYTKRRYADDPGVAMVELANENALAMFWLTGGVERLPEGHRATLDTLWNDFLRTRYPDDAALRAAWTGSVNPGLRPGETLGQVGREPSGQGNFPNWPTARVADLYDFYLGLDQRFFTDLAAEVRRLGFKQPIVPGITWDTPMMALVMAPYDVVDAHIEWDAPHGRVLRNESIIANPRSQQLLDRFRVAQWGKPMMVSELNNGFPNDHMAEAPLFWASMASLQDWDAIIWLNYVNGPIEEEAGSIQGFADMRAAATKWVQMPMASGLFRSGAIAPASGLVPQWRSTQAVKEETVQQGRPVWSELRDVSVALATRFREGYGGEPPLTAGGRPGKQVGWWPDAHRFVVSTDTVEAVIGGPGDAGGAPEGEGAGPHAAPNLDPRLENPAAVSLMCTNGTLAACREGVLTVAARMENVGMKRVGGGEVILEQGDGGVVVERSRGSVRFRWSGRPEVRPIDAAGALGAAAPVKSAGSGWWTLPLDQAGDALTWQIETSGG